MVAPDAWGGELVQNVLSLMEGHQTHTEEGEAEAQNRSESSEMKRKLFGFCFSFTPSDMQNFRGTDHVKTSVTTQKVSSQLGPGTT